MYKKQSARFSVAPQKIRCIKNYSIIELNCTCNAISRWGKYPIEPKSIGKRRHK